MRITNIMNPHHSEVKLKPKKKKLWATALSTGLILFLTQPQTFAAPVTTQQVMVNPVIEARVTSPYGAKNKIHKFHKGIDLGAKIDTPIVASSAGVVRVSTDLLENKKSHKYRKIRNAGYNFNDIDWFILNTYPDIYNYENKEHRKKLAEQDNFQGHII